jgi:hypothetical protein
VPEPGPAAVQVDAGLLAFTGALLRGQDVKGAAAERINRRTITNVT